jgi:hypothetical protein
MPTLPNYLVSVRLGNTTRVGKELIVTCEDETGALGTTVPSLSPQSPCADFLAVCPAAVRTWFQETIRVIDPGAIVAVVRCGSYDSLVVPSSPGVLEAGLCGYLAEFDCSVGESTTTTTTAATVSDAPPPPTDTTVAPTTTTEEVVNTTTEAATKPPSMIGPPGEEEGGGGGAAAAVIIILLLLGCGVAFYILFVRQKRPLPWTGRPLGEPAPGAADDGRKGSRGGSRVGDTEMTTAATSPPARPPPTPATPSPAVDSPAMLPMASTMAYDSESDEETIDIARRKSAKGSKVKSGGSRVKRGTGGSRVATGGTPLLTTPVKSAGSGVSLAPRTPAADAAPNTPSSVTPRKPRTAKSPKTPKSGGKGKGKGGAGSRGSTNKRSSGSSGAARVSRKEKVAAEGESGRISNLLDFVEADE